jgi:BirA family biotin operon repressor/biotin-[acetyl-CoA-carboxylase] ligase
MTDVFHLDEMQRALAATRFTAFTHFASIGSTNTALMRAADSLADGTVYLADEQTAGRGRGGHAWHSAPGDGLYLSALVRPALPLTAALKISLATGLAAWQAVHELTGLSVDLRWPNDLMLASTDGTPQKKLGGILVESSTTPQGQLRHAVIGIGINVHHAAFPLELAAQASSLQLACVPHASTPDRTTLAIAVLTALDHELRRMEDRAYVQQELLTRFTTHSSWALGKRVHVAEDDGYTGVTDGLDDHGFLRVAGDDGVAHTVRSGGVREALDSPAAH